jgi:hypothetical protein
MLSRVLAALCVAVCVAGCALTPHMKVTGSAATGALLDDAIMTVSMVDQMYSAGCKQSSMATAEPVRTRPGEPETERWHVTRCGRTDTYRVSFVPSPAGEPVPKAGRGVSVKRDQ